MPEEKRKVSPAETAIVGGVVVFVTLITLAILASKAAPPALAYFKEVYCSNFRQAIVNGWKVDQITFNWSLVSTVGMPAALAAKFIVYGHSLWSGAWENGPLQGNKWVDLTFGASTVGITESGTYPYTVEMRALAYIDGELQEIASYTYKGEIYYEIGG